MKTNNDLETIPLHAMKRMRAYLNFLRFANLQNRSYVSADRIADEFNLSKQTVLDDLSYTAAMDPELGITNTRFMIDSIEKILGFNHENEFVYIGDASWYQKNKPLIEANIDISVSAFFDDISSENPKMGSDFIINPYSKLPDLAQRMHIKRAIIAPGVELDSVQKLLLLMSNHGVNLVWNLSNPIEELFDVRIVNTPVVKQSDVVYAIEEIKNQLLKYGC